MVEQARIQDGDDRIGDLLVKIRGRHYLIPAEAIGAPLEDGGTEILGELEKELNAVGAAHDSRFVGVDFAMELGETEAERSSRLMNAGQAGDLAEDEPSSTRQSRLLGDSNRSARLMDSPNRTARLMDSPSRTARLMDSPSRSARLMDSPSRTARLMAQ